MKEPVILGAVRTPIAKKGGALRDRRPDALYACVLDELVSRSGVDPARIEDVITGCVTQAGEQAANIGRLGVLLSSLPHTVPAMTLNRMCGSSQEAIHCAARAVAAGDADYVIAGGVESMTRAPMFSDLGGGLDNLNPALPARMEIVHQGESAERIAERYILSRRAMDEYACHSHLRAARATNEGWFHSQMMALPSIDPHGQGVLLERDEGIRPEPDLERMAALPPAFRPQGAITAGNSSQISDGAAALLIGERGRAEADGFRPRARFRARATVAGDPTLQLLEVIPATREALRRAQLTLRDLDVIEVNEAFACVVLAWTRELQPDLDRVNPNGGAIAHGHPLGATGAVLMTKLLHELERVDGRFGLQVMCIGFGMATATVIERL